MTYKKVSISVKVFEKTNAIIAQVSDRPILLAKYNGNYYAIDAVCSHMGCALLTKVEEKTAICPAHDARYDITTGVRIAEAKIKPEIPCEYEDYGSNLKTYKVRENQGFLEVDL